ncbi:MAG: tripartite tricarboxylate transporter substrate binding protein [Peptococcaceae bacterium]|nr:tripartite tricarboxylate transporter substrate binding protein [Peptococcaceae bacterium]
MKKIKGILMIGLILSILLSMVGCGGQTGQANASQPGGQGGTPEGTPAEDPYPEKPIDMIIVWTAGGGSDLAARLIGDYAAAELGQAFVYQNVTGSNGAIGWDQAVNAKADGYTLANLTFDVLTNQAMGQTTVKYDDFDLIMQFTTQPVGVFVPGDSPYQNLEELLAAAAEKPETLQMGTTALGGFFHQASGLLEAATDGARFKYLPYKGSAEIIAALSGKHVDAGIQTLTGMEQHIQEGSIRMLAVLANERSAIFPEVPTAKELGYDVSWESWRGFGVPKGTPEAVRAKLEDAFKKAYDNPEFQAKAKAAGMDLYYRGSADFKALLDEQYPNVETVLKQLNFIQ